MEKSLLRSKPAFTVCALTILTLFSAGQASRTAGSAGAYLRPAAGASAQAMGGAFLANPEYLVAWYNPSVLASLRESRLALGGGYRSLGRTEGIGSYEFRVPPRLGVGLSFLYRGVPSIKGMFDGFYEGGNFEEIPLERLSFSTFTIKLGAGYLLNRSLFLGASIGIFNQSLPSLPLGDGTVKNSSVTAIGGFDLAATYRVNRNWIVSAAFKNLGASFDWYFETWQMTADRTAQIYIMPSLVFGSSVNTTLRDKPLRWNMDLVTYLFDGNWSKLPRNEAVVNTGFEWQYWEGFFIKAGIADLEFSADLFNNSSEFFRHFAPRFCAGFSWDMSQFREGMRLNYALATDRVWAGVDQQIDITFTF